MLNQKTRNALAAWSSVSAFVYVPHTEQEYRQLVILLDELIDEVGEDEHHPLSSLMEVLGSLVEKYENDNVAELEVTGE